ncbi:hypothetical protein MMA231_02461 [Asticcacaulis sp. MM231]
MISLSVLLLSLSLVSGVSPIVPISCPADKVSKNRIVIVESKHRTNVGEGMSIFINAKVDKKYAIEVKSKAVDEPSLVDLCPAILIVHLHALATDEANRGAGNSAQSEKELISQLSHFRLESPFTRVIVYSASFANQDGLTVLESAAKDLSPDTGKAINGIQFLYWPADSGTPSSNIRTEDNDALYNLIKEDVNGVGVEVDKALQSSKPSIASADESSSTDSGELSSASNPDRIFDWIENRPVLIGGIAVLLAAIIGGFAATRGGKKS